MIAMEEIDRITPPLPTLPPPVGRNVGSKRRRTPRGGAGSGDQSESEPLPTTRDPDTHPSDHIDEYV